MLLKRYSGIQGLSLCTLRLDLVLLVLRFVEAKWGAQLKIGSSHMLNPGVPEVCKEDRHLKEDTRATHRYKSEIRSVIPQTFRRMKRQKNPKTWMNFLSFKRY